MVAQSPLNLSTSPVTIHLMKQLINKKMKNYGIKTKIENRKL